MISVYANWGFARIKGTGWGWAGVIWLYSVVTYVPLDFLKFSIRYILSGKAWDNLLENKVVFTIKEDYGKEERENMRRGGGGMSNVNKKGGGEISPIPAISRKMVQSLKKEWHT